MSSNYGRREVPSASADIRAAGADTDAADAKTTANASPNRPKNASGMGAGAGPLSLGKLQREASDPAPSSTFTGEQKQWMDDGDSPECLLCGAVFTLTNRRHHCRLCYKLVCGNCSKRKVQIMPTQSNAQDTPQVSDSTQAPQRVCDECYDIHLSSNPNLNCKNTVTVVPGGLLRESQDVPHSAATPTVNKEIGADSLTASGLGSLLVFSVVSLCTDSQQMQLGLDHPAEKKGKERARYCVSRVRESVIGQTSSRYSSNANSGWYEWAEEHSFLIDASSLTVTDHIYLEVYEKGRKMNADQLLARCRAPLPDLLSAARVNGTTQFWVKLYSDFEASNTTKTVSIRACGKVLIRLKAIELQEEGEAMQSQKHSQKQPFSASDLASLRALLQPKHAVGGESGYSRASIGGSRAENSGGGKDTPLPPSSASRSRRGWRMKHQSVYWITLDSLCPPNSPMYPYLYMCHAVEVPKNEVIVDIFHGVQFNNKTSKIVRMRDACLLITSHRIILLDPLHDDKPLQIPLAGILSVKVGKSTSRFPSLEVSCKSQANYLFLVVTTASRASKADQEKESSSISVEKIFSRLHLCREEILWRVAEDNFAFRVDRRCISASAGAPDNSDVDSSSTSRNLNQEAYPSDKRAVDSSGLPVGHRRPSTHRVCVEPTVSDCVSEIKWEEEFERLGVLRSKNWRISEANENYVLCSSYPRKLCVPKGITDMQLADAAKFRSRRRLPVLTWMHPKTQAPLCRSSQPLVGLTSSRCQFDETLLMQVRETCVQRTKGGHSDRYSFVVIEGGSDPCWTDIMTEYINDDSSNGPPSVRSGSIVLADAQAVAVGRGAWEEEGDQANVHLRQKAPRSSVAETGKAQSKMISIDGDRKRLSERGSMLKLHQPILRIMDARPFMNSMGNTLMGMGHEVISRLGGEDCTRIDFLNIANIHVMRESFAGLRSACQPGVSEKEDVSFFSKLHDSQWLHHCSAILKGAEQIALHLENGDPVLVHCSDGWDRTTQLCALAQILLDPFYRTIRGFQVLVEKDWVGFGHMFAMRSGSDNESSPVFIQFLDAVWQVFQQFSTCFEFNGSLLVLLAQATYSRYFRNFLFNSECEKKMVLFDEWNQGEHPRWNTLSVWDVVNSDIDKYKNILYNDEDVDINMNIDGKSVVNVANSMLRPQCSVRHLRCWRDMYFSDFWTQWESLVSREQILEAKVEALQEKLDKMKASQDFFRDQIRELGSLRQKHNDVLDKLEDWEIENYKNNTHHIARHSFVTQLDYSQETDEEILTSFSSKTGHTDSNDVGNIGDSYTDTISMESATRTVPPQDMQHGISSNANTVSSASQESGTTTKSGTGYPLRGEKISVIADYYDQS